ncbi:hypothetical protein FACS1894103_0630 [Campylobacterota bacterium]|nr:hypothetical protein FACS1894103_0480 [Campylobacterota bacterium]GHV58701.1 hypothetical protein FACS1894103_0630 [Campylobacterota bacterium]
MRETRGAIAYRKRLERKLEPVQKKPKQRQWWAEMSIYIVANLAVWITGSGIIGQMLENKSAGNVILLGVSVIIITIMIVVAVERIEK